MVAQLAPHAGMNPLNAAPAEPSLREPFVLGPGSPQGSRTMRLPCARRRI